VVGDLRSVLKAPLRCPRRDCAPRAPVALLCVLATAGWICACASPVRERPQPSLLPTERLIYTAAKTLSDVFSEAGRVQFRAQEEYLSVRPLLKAIDRERRFVVLDKLNVRAIYVFGENGSPAGRIGTEGRALGEYTYPHTVGYSADQARYYVYDGDLLRVLEFGEDFQFRRMFDLALFVDQLLVTPEGRIFCYSSSRAKALASKAVVHEIDDEGRVLRGFAPQSKRYSGWAASEGGGIAYARGWLYVITPYEYLIAVYDLSGNVALRRTGSPDHYVPPGPPPKAPDGVDRLKLAQAYHRSWSHIRQLLLLDDKMIGVVYAAPGEERVFLDLYELDLTPVASALELPEYAGDLLAHGDSLYALTPARITGQGVPLDRSVVRYRLVRPQG